MHSDSAIPLAGMTTLRLGGPARRLATVSSAEDTVDAVRAADAAGDRVLVLAGGSNVVVPDAGFDGTVLLLRSAGIRAVRGGDTVAVTVAAGHDWDSFVAWTVAEHLAGVECLSGVPGSAGATPIQNVGAYGQEVADTITAVTAYDRVGDEVVTLTPAECGFTYRHSVFKGRDRYVVLDVTFALRRGAASPLRFGELTRVLDVPAGGSAPPAEVREAVLALRRGKGMVLDPDDPDTWSVGSFFTNPVVPAAEVPEGAPRFAAGDGRVKTSAAWLIEHAGFTRGYGRDGVSLSTKHTLALTNRGTGSTEALLSLAREVRDGVRATFGITLVNEPVLIDAEL
ncbi:MAG TPA: UDP-N-acetylmuramate dehydrogenase [Mycobacteriales bacterium]